MTSRIVIAGTHSGAGKTTIATALMAAYARRGLRVQPFKVGPDFIDPGFHDAACGRKSRNLDGWMLSRSANLEVFGRAADADLAIVEGVMGLFDGRDATSESGSTAEMAKWLAAPVVLVVDASAMARSAAAVVRGFESFDAELDVAGVLFNRVGGRGHADLLREATAGCCRAEMIGALPSSEKISMPSRHLGLVMAREALTASVLDEMAAWVEGHLDLDALLSLAREHSGALPACGGRRETPRAPRVRVGVARDRAFCFYYEDNLDLLREAGAELVEFSPIAESHLPADLGGIYLGGGYPELHAAALSGNHTMLAAVREFAAGGGPVYAECGGFMYLTEAIVEQDGREHPMAGLFPTRARMQPRLAALGYLEAEACADAPWLRAGERVRGHEFRFSEIDPMPAGTRRCLRLHGSRDAREEGYQAGSVVGGYAHLHFGSCPAFAERFVAACRQYRKIEHHETHA
jgi:cobyrinic acid a,c-diamide synthase